MEMFQSLKIRINNVEHSKEVQEALFKAGYRWKNGYYSYPKYMEQPFLFTWIDSFGEGFILYDNSEADFIRSVAPEYVLKNGEFVLKQNLFPKQDEVPEFTDVQARMIMSRAIEKCSSTSAQLIYIVEEVLRTHKSLFEHHFK